LTTESVFGTDKTSVFNVEIGQLDTGPDCPDSDRGNTYTIPIAAILSIDVMQGVKKKPNDDRKSDAYQRQ